MRLGVTELFMSDWIMETIVRENKVSVIRTTGSFFFSVHYVKYLYGNRNTSFSSADSKPVIWHDPEQVPATSYRILSSKPTLMIPI
jgi:hypothetical protein